MNTATNYGNKPGMHPAPMQIVSVKDGEKLPDDVVIENEEWKAVYKLAYSRTNDWNVYGLVSVEIKEEK